MHQAHSILLHALGAATMARQLKLMPMFSLIKSTKERVFEQSLLSIANVCMSFLAHWVL